MSQIEDIQHGDHVKVVKDGEEFFGVLMPNATTDVVIKLKSGYNVGFAPEGLHLSLIHISEPTRLRRISYAVFCLKKKKKKKKKKKNNILTINKKKKIIQ